MASRNSTSSRRGGMSTAASLNQLVRCRLEMLAQAIIDLVDRGRGGGHLTDRVQQHEVVNRAVVANRGDRHSGILQLPCVSLTLVAQRVVFRGDDERRRQALELVDAGAKR